MLVLRLRGFLLMLRARVFTVMGFVLTGAAGMGKYYTVLWIVSDDARQLKLPSLLCTTKFKLRRIRHLLGLS